jgi:protein TonB
MIEEVTMRSILPFLTLAALVLAMPAVRAQDAQVYTSADGVTMPVPVTQVRPQYTAAAMDRHIEGTVLLECVVAADGMVGDVKVTESLDSMYGLDAQAVEALRQWTFKPGSKDGKAVAVRVHITMKFTLQ